MGRSSRGRLPNSPRRNFPNVCTKPSLHEALIQATQQERLIGRISRDSTETEAREKPLRTPVPITPAKSMRKRGRPKKGEPSLPPGPTRLERQAAMTLEQMLDDLPRASNVGGKKNSQGHKETWVGYKLHLDVADGQIPIIDAHPRRDAQQKAELQAEAKRRKLLNFNLI